HGLPFRKAERAASSARPSPGLRQRADPARGAIVIQAKGRSVKPESAQTVRAAFALPRNAVSLRPRPMARRKRVDGRPTSPPLIALNPVSSGFLATAILLDPAKNASSCAVGWQSGGNFQSSNRRTGYRRLQRAHGLLHAKRHHTGQIRKHATIIGVALWWSYA